MTLNAANQNLFAFKLTVQYFQSVSLLDDNSNQSSIADSSPVKQENSCSTSPAPEPTSTSHRDNGEAKTDQSPDSKRGQALANTLPNKQTDTHTLNDSLIQSSSSRWWSCIVRWVRSPFLFLFLSSEQIASHCEKIKMTASAQSNTHTGTTDTVQLPCCSPRDFNHQPSFTATLNSS